MPLDMLFWGITFGVVGKILLGITVMLVHHKIVTEHKIDKVVLSEMRRESRLALAGVIFIAVGYILEITYFGYVPFF